MLEKSLGTENRSDQYSAGMDINQFINLPLDKVAQIVRSSGAKVCVFPINGTRRWFLLEYPPETWGERDFLTAYHEISIARQLEIYRLFFDHGIHTLMMPLFGPDLMERGSEYVGVIVSALAELASDPVFLDFYQKYGVRVRFYGDYRRYFKDTPHAWVCDLFDQVSETTRHNDSHRLLYGIFGHDATETVAELSVQYYQQHHSLPDKRKIVEMYYGEYVEPVDFFIGFDRFSAFDMPLVATGTEDLYFTASPSFYLSQEQLRRILFDHLFSRKAEEQEYQFLQPEAVQRMRDFYQCNRDCTFGVGVVRDGFWYPLTTVTKPQSFID